MGKAEQSPSVSIVMPLFNKEADVQRSIRSVFRQTISDFELIVVNDGSTDKGPEIIRSICDSRIKIFDQSNAGVSAARNKGIAESKAGLIAFLDADDEWKPDFLESILRLRAGFSDCDIFATSYFFLRKDGGIRKAKIRGLPSNSGDAKLEDYFRIATQSDPPLWTSAVAVSRRAIMAVNGFPEGISSGEDLLTWARLALRYKIAYCCEPKALFYEPEAVSCNPRPPQVPDFVGDQLIQCAAENPGGGESIKNYAGLWFKMRAVLFMRTGQRKEALKEISKALRYSRFNFNLFVLITLLLMPNSISQKLFSLSKLIRESGVPGMRNGS